MFVFKPWEIFTKYLVTKVFAARTSTEDPILQFMFRVTVPGFPSGIGFTTVSGLSEEISVTEYHENGYPYAHKLPGRTSVGEITATRGEYLGQDFMKNEVKKAVTNKDFRQTIIIEKLNRFGSVAKTYKLAEAWVSSWEGGGNDASSDDVSVEQITIQFEYYL